MFEYVLAFALQSAVAGESPSPQSAPMEQETGAPANGDTPVIAASVAEEPQDESPVEDTTTEMDQPLQVTVPAKHRILISIDAQVGSKISTAKDFFPIQLAQAVVIDGVEVLPAGITGEGQVVHAQKAGFGGSAGELLLAARYLMHGDRRIELRSFKFLEEGDELTFKGTDNSNAVIATATALGPLGLLIGGGNTVIEPGTAATAKFRHEEIFEVASDGETETLTDQQEGN